MSFRGGIGRSRNPGRVRRISDGDDRLGVEAVIGLHDFVFFGFGLIDVAEGPLVLEGEMGVVE